MTARAPTVTIAPPAAECVARTSCAGCARAIVVSGPDAYAVLDALGQELEDAAWSLDRIGRRVCPTCAVREEPAPR